VGFFRRGADAYLFSNQYEGFSPSVPHQGIDYGYIYFIELLQPKDRRCNNVSKIAAWVSRINEEYNRGVGDGRRS
jgi:hypothetical protein